MINIKDDYEKTNVVSVILILPNFGSIWFLNIVFFPSTVDSAKLPFLTVLIYD